MLNPNGLPDRILILGDESKSARAIERLLSASGYGALVLDSFELAREHMRVQEVSLIIIEPSSSRISGQVTQSADNDSGGSFIRHQWAQQALKFCEEIRSDKSTTEVPILVISKSQRPQDKVACLNRGATDYIPKPYQRAELLSRVNAHLRLSRYERERAEKFEQLNVLHAVASVLSSSLEPEMILRGALTVLMSHLRAEAGVVFLRDTDSQAMTTFAAEGFDSLEDQGNVLLDLYSRIAPLMNGEPLVLEPLPESARKGLAGGILQNVHGLICAPLGLKDNRAGAICLFSGNNSAFAKNQVELIATISYQLSVALENARLYVEAKKSAAQLSFVYNLGNNLMTSLEMDELLGYAVFTVGKSLDCDACAVVVRSSSESDNLASAIYSRKQSQTHGHNWYSQERIKSYLNSADGLQPAIQIRVAERFLRDTSIAIETTVPLMFDDRVLGVLICGNNSAHLINSDDQKLLGAVAQQLSLAIRNTELYQRTKDTSINLAVEVSRRTREAEEQKRFTEKIIDSLPVSLYVVDRDMRIVAWNRNREVGGRGINREDVLGRNVFHVLTRQPRRKLEDEFTDVFRSGELVNMEQESWYEGQRKIWKISKIPMRVDNAEVSHVITVGEDITEQKKMNEAVIHAEKLASIGRLAAGVVHELNNPLATIAACAEALTARLDELESTDLNQDFGEYLQIVRDEAFRCKTITNSLLEFSHQRQAEKIASEINNVIEQTLQLTRHHPKLAHMHVVKELEAELEPVYINEGQMKQVFIALISNAFDAMNEQGSLVVRTKLTDSEIGRVVAIEFEDNGCGIAEKHLQKIFDPFFTTKPLGRGTGLGLSVCYGIVSEHGGKIEVDSTEGVGTTFRVLLPIYREADEQARERQFETVLEMESA